VVEDCPLDIELISDALIGGGIEFEAIRIDSLCALREALELRDPDLILSDFALPGFDGFAALQVAREVCPDVPFILVSGAVGDETAIELLKSGATDYVLKHRLEQLPTAVSRAVQEARERACRRRAQLTIEVLAEVGRTVGSSLYLEATLPLLACRLVPAIADHCLIDLVNDDDSIHRVAVADVNPDRALRLTASRTLFPLDPSASYGTMAVLRSGQPEVVPSLDVDWHLTHARTPELREAIRTLGCTSYLIVPLLRADRAIGGIVMASAGSGRRYSLEDLPLAEEVARRTVVAIENARLYHRAQEAIRDRAQLLAVVSHDLRNPLSAIHMSAHLMKRDLAAEDDAGRRRSSQLGVILNATDRMTHLVNSLLDMASLEGGHIQLEQTWEQVGSLLDCVLEMMQPLAARSRTTLELQGACGSHRIRCDRERILQVFSNVVGNAIRFAPEGSTVAIRTELRELELRFSIVDQGPGIAREDLPFIFDRFWQKRRRDAGGAGLGLFIAEGIVEAHGGQMWAESVPGEGSTFWFSLPHPRV
jgi:signal transduction histidine kinase